MWKVYILTNQCSSLFNLTNFFDKKKFKIFDTYFDGKIQKLNWFWRQNSNIWKLYILTEKIKSIAILTRKFKYFEKKFRVLILCACEIFIFQNLLVHPIYFKGWLDFFFKVDIALDLLTMFQDGQISHHRRVQRFHINFYVFVDQRSKRITRWSGTFLFFCVLTQKWQNSMKKSHQFWKWAQRFLATLVLISSFKKYFLMTLQSQN